MSRNKAVALTLLLTISTVAASQDKLDIESALALSYSVKPQDRITASNILGEIDDPRAGERIYQLANDTNPYVKAEVLLAAMNGGLRTAINSYRRSFHESFEVEWAVINNEIAESERSEKRAALIKRMKLDYESNFDNRPVHIKWLVSFSKEVSNGPLLDKISTLIIKEADPVWSMALNEGYYCYDGASISYNSRFDLIDLYERNPKLYKRLARTDEQLTINLYGTLATEGDKSTAPYLIKLTSSSKSFTRATALLALTQVAPESAKEFIPRLLKDKKGIVRGAAAIALLAMDPEQQLQKVKQLCIDDFEIADQVFTAISRSLEFDTWRKTGLLVAAFPSLTEEKTLELCKGVAISGDSSAPRSALLALAQCSNETAIEQLLVIRNQIKAERVLDHIGWLLKELGYDPPVR